MKILIVGSGGREHAIAASVAKSPKAEKIYCAPGNAGIAQLAECVPIGAMEFDRLTEFAKEKEIDLVIVGMDDPLVGGLVDQLEAAGIRAFGPRKNAAILEGSKAFSKELMKKYNIPTAAYEVFDKAEDALEYLHTKAKFPIVLKADGLALGKGVLICSTLEEAEDGVCTIMTDKKFGTAGNKLVQTIQGRATDTRVYRGEFCRLEACLDDNLVLSGLFGNCPVKRLPAARMLPVLRREKGRLQTAGLICAPERRLALAQRLMCCGLVRITRAGDMSESLCGEAHDGEYPLRRYVRIVEVEP